MKKLLVSLIVPVLALGLASCNRSEEDRNRITLSVSTQTNPFFVELLHGAQDKAKELDVPLDIQDASDDPAQQVNQLGNATSMGAKVVVINPTDSDAVAPAVRSIKNDGVPVIGVDRDVNGVELDSMVASDNEAGGAQAADKLAESIGEEGEILVLQGTAGTSASRERGKGFEERIAQYPGIKIAGKQSANFDRTEGLNVTTNLLQANPNISAIFAENDEMALGAVEALGSRAGKEVKIVAFDGTFDGLKAVKDGKLEATIAQQPAELGARAIEQAAALLHGESAEKNVPVEVITVTKDTVEDFQ
ncbi:substrate-binding domain-containing protein [Corynebacterium accolens]|uniref:substrate-binding domain-containing protein n=1 Tax=Corynebacterium accolens TaxID=38284 RepID=UPI0025517EDC|nr:substrate-binding domain-containing protein [Corynebacterium accolens]MDK8471482.1 substrate-binding domain-containing protein [Corynebacterium accolens]MDK8617453.1 substrate-binding domain-containing protein [Corynebacterium accolens]